MDKIIVHGGSKLSGCVRISGSKNSALPILAATLLTKEPCVIARVPDLSDIHYMLTILSQLGCEVERASGTVTVKAENVLTDAPYDIVRKMRASICVLGPLLGREKEATVSLPGGCVIGDRPIDLHLRGFEALGAAVRVQRGDVKVLAPELRGATINLRGKFGSTVLGTDNVMMAAVLADGTTVIDGAAEEPEVEDLANFLIAMGAKIEGAGSRRIIIEAGFSISTGKDSVTLRSNGAGRPLKLETCPYPGFPTDMQAQMCALLSTIDGISVITETVFPQRFMHVAELKRMGANIELEGSTAVINGVEKLSGAPVMASDLRASAALVLAGLQAENSTEINRVYHIDRGYESLDEKLNALGAQIERVKV
jgi:UDP-N-acetylglucosamine 1-carboxyvinyltransferase